MKNVALAPYVRLCAISGLGPWVLMKLGQESLAGNFNLVAQPRKIKQNKTKQNGSGSQQALVSSTLQFAKKEEKAKI